MSVAISRRVKDPGLSRTTTVVRLLAVGAVAALAGGIVLHVLTPQADRLPLLETPEPVVGPVAALGGAYLLRYAPADRVLRLLTAVGCFACVYAAAAGGAAYGASRGLEGALAVQVATWLAHWVWVPGFLGLVLVLPQIFPDGRCVSRRWRPLLWATYGVIAVLCLATAFSGVAEGSGLPRNPAAVVELGRAEPLLGAAVMGWAIAVLVLALVGVVVRVRRAGPVERRQIAWLGYAVVVAAVASALLPPPWNTVGSLAVPLAIGVAATRYRLYDIDVVFNRTLVAGGLLGGSAVLYFAVVGWLGGLAGERGALVGFLGAIAVAAAFNPLYRALRQGVDRLLHGRRDRHLLLTSAAAAIREATSPREALERVCRLVGDDLRLPAVVVTVPRPGAADLVVEVGSSAPDGARIPLRWHGEDVGTLAVARRRGQSPWDDVDHALLADVATQLAAVAFAVRLTADLERSRELLRSSQEEERRRMRRDLHDGLGPLLASAAMALDVAQRAYSDRPQRGQELVTVARTQLQEAVRDVRRLVDGLRPPALDDLGLVDALRMTGPAAVADEEAVTVRVEGVGDLSNLPAAVEVAAFRIGQEAITNAARHSGASTVTVQFERAPDSLTLRVEDDGCGIPPEAPHGLGLRSMAQRVAELDGSIEIVGEAGAGTRVTVRLPLRGRSDSDEVVAS